MEQPASSQHSCFAGLFGLAADVLASIHPPKPFEVPPDEVQYIGMLPATLRRSNFQFEMKMDDKANRGALHNGRLSDVSTTTNGSETSTCMWSVEDASIVEQWWMEYIRMKEKEWKAPANSSFELDETAPSPEIVEEYAPGSPHGATRPGRVSLDSVSSSSASTLQEDIREEQDFIFCALPTELSKTHLLQCLAVRDVCSLRASCQCLSAPQVLVDHFAYLVNPSRPEVYIAMAGVVEASDKLQFKQDLGYELQARIRGIVSLFLKGHIEHWWQINSSAVMKILAGLQTHSKISTVQFGHRLPVLVCKFASKLFKVPDKDAQTYLLRDLLDILHSDDSNYLDKLSACVTFRYCSCHLGPLHEECLATLGDIVMNTKGSKRLHKSAVKTYEMLSRVTETTTIDTCDNCN